MGGLSIPRGKWSLTRRIGSGPFPPKGQSAPRGRPLPFAGQRGAVGVPIAYGPPDACATHPAPPPCRPSRCGGRGRSRFRRACVRLDGEIDSHGRARNGGGLAARGAKPVSYTHLTLPTIYSV